MEMKKDTEYGLYAEQFAEEQWKEMGERIKAACNDAGYKLSDLARLLGVEVRQIYRITKGELPCKSEYIYEFSQVLGVSTDYLFFGKEDAAHSRISDLCKNRTEEQLVTAYNILLAYFGGK